MGMAAQEQRAMLRAQCACAKYKISIYGCQKRVGIRHCMRNALQWGSIYIFCICTLQAAASSVKPRPHEHHTRYTRQPHASGTSQQRPTTVPSTRILNAHSITYIYI